jgi:hypothetical protein
MRAERAVMLVYECFEFFKCTRCDFDVLIETPFEASDECVSVG